MVNSMQNLLIRFFAGLIFFVGSVGIGSYLGQLEGQKYDNHEEACSQDMVQIDS